jgi:periplasmic copper chaperone A
MHSNRPGAVFIAALLIALGACSRGGSDNLADAACEGAGIAVSDAWMRAARAGQPTSAAYLTLCNGAAADDVLISVSLAGAQHAELHKTTMKQNGVASMASSPGLALPAGSTASLAPGGGHIMLMGLEQAFAPGDAPVLQLQFENAPALEVALEVRSITDQGR